jgi:hypothetical protein
VGNGGSAGCRVLHVGTACWFLPGKGVHAQPTCSYCANDTYCQHIQPTMSSLPHWPPPFSYSVTHFTALAPHLLTQPVVPPPHYYW